MKRAAITLLLAIASGHGCASTSFDIVWWKAREAAPGPWAYLVAADTERVCRGQGAEPTQQGGSITACATWRPDGCTIYLPERAPAWLIEHEERHCRGEVHD